jgi:ElaB/YqjD/DUF883 family membrane-anchored ribosome-binding protein
VQRYVAYLKRNKNWEMAANKDDNKILNAIRLHLVLLNVANEVVQFNLTELIKQKDSKNSNAVKYFLIKNYQANLTNPPFYLDGFMRTLNEKFGGNTLNFPNDLKEFDITACYPIARNFLYLSKIQMRPFDELREIRNKKYGHLNLLEIEDTDYKTVLASLEKLIDYFTQNAPQYQQDLRDRIKQIELIQALSSISSADMSNLKEIILDLILKNRDMFSQIGQVNKDIDGFIATSKEFQKSHAEKIDEIRQLSFELKQWSESIKSQNISQEQMNKIGEVVSAHLNRKLNFEETLKPYFEDVKSHVSSNTNEMIAEISNVTHDVISHVSNVATAQTNEIITRVESKLQPLGIKICLNKVNTGRTRKESPALIFLPYDRK